jgi:biotin carboxyl carrier protein
MTLEPQREFSKTLQILADINRLSLKAFKAKTAKSLIFLILNDTVPIIRYNRAVLWKMGEGKEVPELLGVSGQVTINKNSDLVKHWLSLVQKISDPKVSQILSADFINLSQSPGAESQKMATSVLWLPIFANDKLALGLWLERWGGIPWRDDEIEILNFLMQIYGASWEKYSSKISLKPYLFNKPFLYTFFLLACVALFVRIPLRVVAPAEIVPKDPIVVTAPLEGIIEEVVVAPGEQVSKGTLLFSYDKRVPLQELKVAQKKVEISQAELDRSKSLAPQDKKAITELAIIALKLQKEKIDLGLAEYHASLLDVKSPAAGVVVLDNPEEWRGKPVHVGEKVLMISDPTKTKIRIWVPEDDNVILDPQKPIKVFLNINPEISRQAFIKYIANYTVINEKQVPSFIAEAEWAEEPKDIKLGLKGTAILYGNDVSIFYWIIRKPWAYLRRLLGF